MKKEDVNRVRLALTPLYESVGETISEQLCEHVARSVELLMIDERFRCFSIALEHEAEHTANRIAGDGSI